MMEERHNDDRQRRWEDLPRRMRLPFKTPQSPEFPRDWFETKSHAWEEAGLARQVAQRAARRARRQVLVLAPILVGILVAYSQRKHIGLDEPIRWITVIALVIVGWAFARSIGEVAGPSLFRRMDPATAGTVGFLMRLVTVAIAVIVALRIAGLSPQSLAVGGAFTAVIVGLAAQQTLGNLIAGTVLLSARPFRVGERVRLQAGAIGGQIDGVVSSLGLLYTVLAAGEDRIMVPNSQVLSAVVIPRREPAAVDLRARLPHRIAPSEVQTALDQAVSVATRTGTHIGLEEFDGDEVVVRIEATPERAADGPRLADEILAAVGELATNGHLPRGGRDEADERIRERDEARRERDQARRERDEARRARDDGAASERDGDAETATMKLDR
ncbi:MAG: MscS Mechanosensitive ion channel [Solirubrobacterales bacterium]|jgi:small conductance mechanosensitive channel|nr:MscS Mechanosensitive ion channel [Solirubrobacterales bacterium]